MIALRHIDTRRCIFRQINQKWPYFLFFGCNFFFVENRENFLFSTDTNMLFPQIFSYISLLYDQWLPRYMNCPHANCCNYIWGGCRQENESNPPKTSFKQVLNHLSGFEHYAFFDFPKNFFHSTLLRLPVLVASERSGTEAGTGIEVQVSLGCIHR